MAKSSPSMLLRFKGKNGGKALEQAICSQPCVAGNSAIAQALIRAGKLVDFPSNSIIIEQGGADNDIYFIVSGEVCILINDREIAIRSSGKHVGEMALIDSTARRSATVKSIQPTIALKVSEKDFSPLALIYPDLWRRIAVELSSRLRERSKFVSPPNDNPTIFIGSSGEALKQADYIAKYLRKKPILVEHWKDIFTLSSTAIESLLFEAKKCDFAALLFTPDDHTKSRGRTFNAARDNVIFELGLFMGSIGRDRTFLITPKGGNVKIPSDLFGMTNLEYGGTKTTTNSKMLNPIADSIYARVLELGPK